MLILGNGRVITRDEKNPYLENGAVQDDRGKHHPKGGSLR